MFVYLLPSTLCGLIVPAEVEEAIRLGELEALSLSKNCEKAIFKIKGRPTLFVPLKEVDIKQANGNECMFFNGSGQVRKEGPKNIMVSEKYCSRHENVWGIEKR